MNRRGFLSLIAPAAAALIVPELVLPKRTFFLPPAGGWHPALTQEYIEALTWRLAQDFANPPVAYFQDRFLAAGGQTIHATVQNPSAWDVDAVLAKACEDRALFGMGVLKFEAGRVHHVPLEVFQVDRFPRRFA